MQHARDFSCNVYTEIVSHNFQICSSGSERGIEIAARFSKIARIHFNECRSHYTIRWSCKPRKLRTLYHFPIFPVSSNILNWCVLLVENQFFSVKINLNTASKKHKKFRCKDIFLLRSLYIASIQATHWIYKQERKTSISLTLLQSNDCETLCSCIITWARKQG